MDVLASVSYVQLKNDLLRNSILICTENLIFCKEIVLKSEGQLNLTLHLYSICTHCSLKTSMHDLPNQKKKTMKFQVNKSKFALRQLKENAGVEAFMMPRSEVKKVGWTSCF